MNKTTRTELYLFWKDHGLTTRSSFKPDYIMSLCEELKIPLCTELIYTQTRYRELAPIVPRIDGLEFLEYICKHKKIKPIKRWLIQADKMLGEGSRREMLQRAYIGHDDKI